MLHNEKLGHLSCHVTIISLILYYYSIQSSCPAADNIFQTQSIKHLLPKWKNNSRYCSYRHRPGSERLT